ncbi:hypothetical protein H4R34_000735 [Dimargaris verticillata]|uniref:Major facilitator superfamily (MFS) profile domain-containing protein n=1 Tax=Dimargaris verticillata TaxID=2761393 RepID=A0A9W8EEF0_9FUNG|nr:hypothetical protein H4R34_000735 [Dimargaris verticillata]
MFSDPAISDTPSVSKEVADATDVDDSCAPSIVDFPSSPPSSVGHTLHPDSPLAKSTCSDAGDLEKSGDVVDPLDEPPFPTFTGLRLVIMVAGVLLAMFPATLDETIIATAMYPIASQFGAMSLAPWLASVYLLAVTAFSPIFGKLSDIFGLRATMFASLGGFFVASLMCALAPSMIVLIIFRALTGIAAAGVLSLSFITISKCVSERERGKYLGYLGIVYCVTCVLGPIIGGALADSGQWRWIFYLNLPICAVSLVIIYFTLQVPVPRGSLWAKVKRVDYPGTAIFVASITCLLLGIEWGGKEYPWKSGIIIGLLVAGVVLLLVFLWFELKVAPEPIFDLGLFTFRNVWIASVLGFFIGWVLFTTIYYVPLYYQVAHQNTATQAGLQLLPFLGSLNVIAVGVGYFTEKVGHYRPVTSLGMACMAIGLGLLYLLTPTFSAALTGFFLGLAGAGVGLAIQMSTMPAQRQVAFDMLAQVVALISFTRTIGGVFGIAAAGAVLHTKLAATVDGLDLGDSATGIEASFSAIFGLAQPEKNLVIGGYADGVRLGLFISFAPAALGFILSLGYVRIARRKKEEALSEG